MLSKFTEHKFTVRTTVWLGNFFRIYLPEQNSSSRIFLGFPGLGQKSGGIMLSGVRLFITPCRAALQAPLSIEFSRQEFWMGCHFLVHPQIGWVHGKEAEELHELLVYFKWLMIDWVWKVKRNRVECNTMRGAIETRKMLWSQTKILLSFSLFPGQT